MTIGDAGLEFLEHEGTRDEGWSTTWVRNDASSWVHASCTLAPDGGEWRVEACSWDGERRATHAARLANSAGAGHEVVLVGAGLEVRLSLTVQSPGIVRERFACRSGIWMPSSPTEQAPQPSTAP